MESGSVMERVLVTGGAGFIGSHTVDLLLERGYDVTVVDCLDPQVHGRSKKQPDYLSHKSRFMKGDVRDREFMKKHLCESDGLIHLAATVGVGQSMYEIERYVSNNTYGTAVILDILANEEHDVEKVVVASSMSVYGEGNYFCEKCNSNVYPTLRSEEKLRMAQWEHQCPNCGSMLKSIPINENKPLMPVSIYAMSKRHQEETCLLTGKTYGIPIVALRYFNVYGSRQALSNPYTGCIAIFASRLLNNKPPLIFEDGQQTRDFIHVRDVAKANLLALEKSNFDYVAINVGTGRPLSIAQIAAALSKALRKKITPLITNKFRIGDIRHCYADIGKLKQMGFQPEYTFEAGLHETLKWVSRQPMPKDSMEKVLKEMEEHGLVK